MTEVVLDVKLASLGVLNITPRGLTDLVLRLSSWDVCKLFVLPVPSQLAWCLCKLDCIVRQSV